MQLGIYPEAIALRSTDAEHIAEELVTFIFTSWSSMRDTDQSGKQFHFAASQRALPSSPYPPDLHISLPSTDRWARGKIQLDVKEHATKGSC